LRTLIRRALPRDADAIEAIHWAALSAAYQGLVPGWPEAPRDIGKRVARWSQWIADADANVLILELADTVVGFSSIRTAADERAAAEMATLYVHPDHWHRGHGQRLCFATVAAARRRQFATLLLWVLEVNERANEFYVRFGFQPDGTTKQIPDSTLPLRARRYRLDLTIAL